MSTWPTSERTALLWGHRWWLAGRPEPLAFESLSHAAEVLQAHLANDLRPARLRLIYQPDTLVTVAAPCPRGVRSVLQKALAGEHPALANPAHAWSHEPILPLGDGFSTLLHYETEPGLLPLIERLGQCGLIVTSAWPLATWLKALPKEHSSTGATLVMAFDDDNERALAYHHPADGRPAVHVWRGASAVDEAQTWLGEETDRLKDAPALLVSPMDNAVPDDPLSLPLHLALASPIALLQSHPAQLLPAAPAVTPQRTAIAASILLLLAGGWSGAAYVRDYLAWTEQQQANRQEKATLQTEIDHYRINTAEIVSLRTHLAGPGSSPPVGALLDAVCSALPAQLALDQIRVAQGRFTLRGHIAPGATAVWEQWRSRFGNGRWKLEPVALRDNGAFTLSGVFLP